MNKVFSNLPRDASTGIIQEANNFVTVDGMGVTSPFTATGGVDVITIPANGAELILYPITNDLFVSEDPTGASGDLVSKGNKEPFPCAGMEFIYVEGQAGDAIFFRIHEV